MSNLYARENKLFDKFNVPRLPDVMKRPSVSKPRLQDIQDSMGKREISIGKRDSVQQAHLLTRDMRRSKNKMRYGL